jgi:inosose dehydratase
MNSKMETSNKSLDGVRLGISPLSWTNDVLHDLGDEIPLEQCLREASEIGYEGVELGRKFPKDPAVLRPKLSEYGLVLAAGWYSGFLADRSLKEEWKAAADHISLLKGCGTSILVYGECGKMPGNADLNLPLSQSPELKSIDLPAYARKVEVFSERLKEEGLVFAYHHHLMMLVEKADEIAAFCDATKDSVGLLLDTGHATAAGADYAEIIRQFGSRIVHIHLKDVRRAVLKRILESDASFNAGVREGYFTVPGDGDVDFSELGKFVRNSGYRGWVIVEAEQDPAKATPKVYAEKAYRVAKELIC